MVDSCNRILRAQKTAKDRLIVTNVRRIVDAEDVCTSRLLRDWMR